MALIVSSGRNPHAAAFERLAKPAPRKPAPRCKDHSRYVPACAGCRRYVTLRVLDREHENREFRKMMGA